MVTKQFTNWIGNHNFQDISAHSVAPAAVNAGDVLFSTTYTYKSPVAKWIDVGFGNSAENSADHCLADANATNESLTCVSQSAITKEDTDVFAAKATFRNDGSLSIIVREIGLFVGKASNTMSSYTDCMLVGRDLLSEPLTIDPGESYEFTYRVGLNAQSVIETI